LFAIGARVAAVDGNRAHFQILQGTTSVDRGRC
jgi:hypothetical protein